MPLQQFDERDIYQGSYTFNDGTTPLSYATILNTFGKDGRMDVLLLTNSDTIDHTVLFDLNDGSGASVAISAVVPAGSGYAGVTPYDLIAHLMPTNQPFLLLAAGFTYQWALGEAINTGRQVVLFVQGGTF